MTINNNPELSEFGDWNEHNPNLLASNNWRASLVPAAAVIPAPIAYIKVVAVKKLVVGPRCTARRTASRRALPFCRALCSGTVRALHWARAGAGTCTLKKLECSKQAIRLNNGAWNNGIGPRFYFAGFRSLR